MAITQESLANANYQALGMDEMYRDMKAVVTELNTTTLDDLHTISVALTEANIIAMYTTPVAVVAAQGADTAIEFISAVLVYDYDTAAYTGGGAIHIEYASGAAISTTIAASNGFGASGDKVFSMQPLNAAGGYTMPLNTALDITCLTGVFADPGTAAGIGTLKITYRVHTAGL